MALIKCSECGHDVSTAAAACPNCGAKQRREEKPKRKGMSIGVWLAVGFGVWMLVFMAMSARHVAETAQEAAAEIAQRAQAEKKRVAALTPEQRAAEMKKREELERVRRAAQEKAAAEKKRQGEAEAKRSQQLANAGNGLIALRRAMKSPESFELKSLIYMESGAVCYDYRAINSYSAKLAGNAVLVP